MGRWVFVRCGAWLGQPRSAISAADLILYKTQTQSELDQQSRYKHPNHHEGYHHFGHQTGHDAQPS